MFSDVVFGKCLFSPNGALAPPVYNRFVTHAEQEWRRGLVLQKTEVAAMTQYTSTSTKTTLLPLKEVKLPGAPEAIVSESAS